MGKLLPSQQTLVYTGAVSQREARERKRLRRQKLLAANNLVPKFNTVPKPTLEPEPEFNLIGEDRDHKVKIDACPECGSGEWQTMEIRHSQSPAGVIKREFRVRCSLYTACDNATPWFNSSSDAVHHWKLVARLSK